MLASAEMDTRIIWILLSDKEAVQFWLRLPINVPIALLFLADTEPPAEHHSQCASGYNSFMLMM